MTIYMSFCKLLNYLRYESLIYEKHLADLELKQLYNALEEDREETEHVLIQADVWRSKFLASKYGLIF